MTLAEALEIVVAQRGERFRTLCAEDNPDVEQRDAYRRLVMQMAGEPSPVAPQAPSAPVASALADIGRVKRCPHWEPRSDCGCGVNWCRRDGRGVALQDCFSCLQGADHAPASG